jgi:hypothetical protein
VCDSRAMASTRRRPYRKLRFNFNLEHDRCSWSARALRSAQIHLFYSITGKATAVVKFFNSHRLFLSIQAYLHQLQCKCVPSSCILVMRRLSRVSQLLVVTGSTSVRVGMEPLPLSCARFSTLVPIVRITGLLCCRAPSPMML